MQVTLHNAGKRFNRDWIFRHSDFTFDNFGSYAITGPNGSGKSTLLQLIAGALQPTEGKVHYRNQEGNEIPDQLAYSHISFAAPYLDLIEEMTALEMLEFHMKFKPCSCSPENMLAAVDLKAAADKQIRYFSSGMKQRLKLGMAFFGEASLLLLDEPFTNLDAAGIDIFKGLTERVKGKKTIIVSSNDTREYSFCSEVIDISAFQRQTGG